MSNRYTLSLADQDQVHDYVQNEYLDLGLVIRRLNEQADEIERLQAEQAATYAVLGEDYDDEASVPDAKRRPLDSCTIEALAQKDNEIERLKESLEQIHELPRFVVAGISSSPEELIKASAVDAITKAAETGGK